MHEDINSALSKILQSKNFIVQLSVHLTGENHKILQDKNKYWLFFFNHTCLVKLNVMVWDDAVTYDSELKSG